MIILTDSLAGGTQSYDKKGNCIDKLKPDNISTTQFDLLRLENANDFTFHALPA